MDSFYTSNSDTMASETPYEVKIKNGPRVHRGPLFLPPKTGPGPGLELKGFLVGHTDERHH
jgi:hypothetical protein